MNWGKIGPGDIVEAHYSSSDNRPPVSGLVELLGRPPFIGGLYDRQTKTVSAVPVRTKTRREELKEITTFADAERDEAIRELL